MAGFLGILAFSFLILFAILFHELGHFATARWAKIKVSKFFIGFGPTLWSTRRGRLETVPGPDGQTITQPETEYGVKAFPVGGFVKIVGMSPMEEVPPEDQPRAFDAAPTWKRAIVLGAGSVTHFITAVVVMFLIFVAIGIPSPSLKIGVVEPTIDHKTSPAKASGFTKGDRILEIDGKKVNQWTDVGTAIRGKKGDPVRVTVRRNDGSVHSAVVRPTSIVDPSTKKHIPVIGISPDYANKRQNPIAAIGSTGRAFKDLLAVFFQRVPQAFAPKTLGLTGGGPSNERPFSIIGAGRLAGELASRGGLLDFLLLFVQINVFIGIFNLLPLPPLDGGHLLVLLIGKIRGKPLSQRAVMPVAAVVLSVLLLLGVLLMYYDIVSPPHLPGP